MRLGDMAGVLANSMKVSRSIDFGPLLESMRASRVFRNAAPQRLPGYNRAMRNLNKPFRRTAPYPPTLNFTDPSRGVGRIVSPDEGFRVWPLNFDRNPSGPLPGTWDTVPPWFGGGTPPPVSRTRMYEDPYGESPIASRYYADRGQGGYIGELVEPIFPQPRARWQYDPYYDDYTQQASIDDMTPQEWIEYTKGLPPGW